MTASPKGWAMPCLAEEILDGQHQRVTIPTHAGTAPKGLQQEKLERDLCLVVLLVPQTTQSENGLN